MRSCARHEEVHDVIAEVVVTVQVVQAGAGALAGQRVVYDFRDATRHIAGAGFTAVAHQQDAVSQQDGLVHVVRDHENRLMRLAHDGHQLVLNGAARERVQRAEGLVEQQHLRLDGKCPRDADALLHAAGELRGLLVDGGAQAHHRDELLHMPVDLGRRPLGPARLDGKRDVSAHRQPGHQRMTLEHHAALQAGAGNFTAVHEDVAGSGRVQPRQHVQDGGLAAARMADDADELAAVQRERHIGEHRLGGDVGLAEFSILRKPSTVGVFLVLRRRRKVPWAPRARRARGHHST